MKKLIIAAALGAVVATPAVAQDYDADTETAEASDFAGVRIEGRVFWERLNDPEEDLGINYELGSGVGFGGELGFDFSVSDTVVVGPYATFDISTIETCDLDLCVASEGYWAIGIHAGLQTGANGQVYAKVGYGQQTLSLEGTFVDPFTTEVFIFDEEDTGGGYNFALGYEHSFGGGPLYGRVEVGISESYDVFGFDWQRANLGVAVGARF